MPFSARCPFCHITIQGVPDAFAGESLECPRCHSYFTLAAALVPSTVQANQATAVAASPANVAVALPPAAAPPKESVPASAVEIRLDVPLYTPPPEPAPAVPRKRPANLWGAFAFLCGSVAVLAVSVPPANVLVVPLSALGTLLGLIGLASLAWKSSGVHFPVAGLVVSVSVGVFALFWPGVLGLPVHGPESAANMPTVVSLRHPNEKALAPREQAWADAGQQAVQQGDVRVRLESAVVKRVQLEHAGGKQLSSQKQLILRLRISNAGYSRILEYGGWDAAAARLTDRSGKEYRAQTFGPGFRIVGQLNHAALAPGKWAEEVLVFEAPPASAAALRLELSLTAFGGSGTLPLEIPRRLILFQ
jgi:hypothetical protein